MRELLLFRLKAIGALTVADQVSGHLQGYEPVGAGDSSEGIAALRGLLRYPGATFWRRNTEFGRSIAAIVGFGDSAVALVFKLRGGSVEEQLLSQELEDSLMVEVDSLG